MVAKDGGTRYEPGRRSWIKVKWERTADCVVGGFRVLDDGTGISSLLLGLYDDDELRHIGVVASFGRARQNEIASVLLPHVVPLAGHPWEHGFALEGGPMGRLKGAAGRWAPDLPLDWIPVRPDLVCEVAYDQVDGCRLRHPARWRRWRSDRTARSCAIEQLAG